jgi:hypothetical protein
MDNRKRANGITGGILLIIAGLLMLALQFPVLTVALISGSITCYGLYQLFFAVRNEIESHLNETDETTKWKQNKNIK